jgi:hypothetical protein
MTWENVMQNKVEIEGEIETQKLTDHSINSTKKKFIKIQLFTTF